MIEVVQARYDYPPHAAAIVALMDTYSRDLAGGGTPLCDFARANLIAELAARPFMFSILALHGDAPVGLINAIEGFSTFACRPLVNVHDVVVVPDYRGRGIAAQMFSQVEVLARQRGACKLTLEVLQGNAAARALYQRLGFTDYQLDPAMGCAQFLHKTLD